MVLQKGAPCNLQLQLDPNQCIKTSCKLISTDIKTGDLDRCARCGVCASRCVQSHPNTREQTQHTTPNPDNNPIALTTQVSIELKHTVPHLFLKKRSRGLIAPQLARPELCDP